VRWLFTVKVCGRARTTISLVAGKKKQKEEESRFHNLLQRRTKLPKPVTRLHLLKVLPPPRSAKLGPGL
jgi:hypothetical protein